MTLSLSVSMMVARWWRTSKDARRTGLGERTVVGDVYRVVRQLNRDIEKDKVSYQEEEEFHGDAVELVAVGSRHGSGRRL